MGKIWIFAWLLADLIALNYSQQIHATLEAVADTEICETGWTRYNRSGKKRCLKIVFFRPSNWWDAEGDCQSKQGHLLSITTTDELASVKEAIKTQNSLYPQRDSQLRWIGLGQICPNDLPRWSDGRQKPTTGSYPLDQELKASADPDQDMCLAIEFSANEGLVSKSWSYQNCSLSKGYICAKDAPFVRVSDDGSSDAIESPPVEPSGFVCGDASWCYNNQSDSCYKIIHDPSSFESSDSLCHAQGAHLASIHDDSELDYITKMVKYHPSFHYYELWIGLNKLNSDQTYTWLDGTPLDFLASINAVDTSLSDLHQGSCVSMTVDPRQKFRRQPFIIRLTSSGINRKVGEWRKKRCADTSLPGVCMKKLGVTSEADPAEDHKDDGKFCRGGWIKYKKHCYKMFGEDDEDKKSVKLAQDACQEVGSNLVSIVDVFEQGFVLSMLAHDREDIWLGLNITNGKAMWAHDSSQFIFNHFNLNTRIMRFNDKIHFLNPGGHSKLLLPSLIGPSEICVFMSGNRTPGFWETAVSKTTIDRLINQNMISNEDSNKTMSCETAKMAYVCKSFPSEPEEPKATENEVKCANFFGRNSNATAFNGSCYAFIETEMTWNDAKSKCASFGNNSHLLEVNDIFDWSYVYSKVQEIGVSSAAIPSYNDFWIGLYEDDKHGLQWSSGGIPTITPWGIGEPSFRKDLKCVTGAISSLFVRAPHWRMEACWRKLPFVCKASNKTAPPKIQSANGTCDDPRYWTAVGSKCYLVVANATGSGYEAPHTCFTRYNSSLASFDSLDEFLAVAKATEVNPTAVHNRYYIGLVHQLGGDFVWVDRSPLTFTNWEHNHPPPMGTWCVSMDTTKEHKWHLTECYNRFHFICSKPQNGLPLSVQSTTEIPKTTVSPNQNETKTNHSTASTPSKEHQVTATTEKSVTSRSKTAKPDAAEANSAKRKTAKGVSTGVVAGIVFCLIFLILVALFVVFLIKKKKIRLFGPREPGFMHFDTLQQDDY